MHAARWAAFAGGLAILLVTATSVLRSLIVPRGLSSRITFGVSRALGSIFETAAGMFTSYKRKDKILAFYGPVAVLGLLAAWFALFLVGYALALLPFTRDTLAGSIREVASSMLTLGHSVQGAGATIVADAAAATGLITVAMLIAYLPAMYSAFNRREALVTTLQTRAGVPAWGPEILARHQLVNTVGNLPKLYADWEYWAAEVGESHTNYPIMVFFRSPHPLRSWLNGLLAVMDSAAMYLAICPDAAPAEARLCLRQGFTTLRDIARVMSIPFDPDPSPDNPIRLTYDEFAGGVARIQAAGFKTERTTEDAWPHFRGWRVNYESIAYTLADLIVAPPGPWSGPRARLAVAEIAPMRPIDRRPGDTHTSTLPPLRTEYPL